MTLKEKLFSFTKEEQSLITKFNRLALPRARKHLAYNRYYDPDIFAKEAVSGDCYDLTLQVLDTLPASWEQRVSMWDIYFHVDADDCCQDMYDPTMDDSEITSEFYAAQKVYGGKNWPGWNQHHALLLDEKFIVDYTARQFNDSLPVPFVFKVEAFNSLVTKIQNRKPTNRSQYSLA